MKIKSILFSGLLLLLGKQGFCDQVAVSKFGLLNNNNNSVTISQTQAQDLLNVDITPGGLSIKKRFGFGTYKTLTTAQPFHGGYHFFNSSGNDVQIWGSSTSLYGITNDATPVQLVSSATLNSTWDCTDTQASAYCVNSSRNAFIKTDGATMTWYQAPLGTMIESTPDRVIVAGVSGSLSTLFVSQSNTFTNFTTGVNPTDAFTEVIAAPGSRITNIRWGCGKLLWWKDASFGYFDFDDQFTAQVKTVSDVVGSFDNTSAIDPGGQVWFRGQDGHTWMYDCSILNKESIDITPNIQLSGKRVANSWVQTTAADFNSGLGIPAVNISTTISIGDVTISSFQAVENSSTQWGSGSTNNTIIQTSSVILSTSETNLTNGGFENGDFSGWSVASTSSSVVGSGGGGANCTLTPQAGSKYLQYSIPFACSGNFTAYAYPCLGSSATATSSTNIGNGVAGCSWTSFSLSMSGDTDKSYQVGVYDSCGSKVIESACFIATGNSMTLYTASSQNPAVKFALDSFTSGVNSTITGSFTSQIYDTLFTSSTFQLQSTWSLSAPTFNLSTSTGATGPFSTLETSTGTNAVGNRYVKYSSTISVVNSSTSVTAITNATILSRSTGTYLSAVHNAPNLTAWSTLGINSVNNGGAQTFYVRSSTNSFSIASTTPSWVSQTNGGLVSASTGTYFQFRDDFGIDAATQTPTLNDFTVNWFEGTAGDQAYMLYFDNAIWETVAFGSGQSINNYIFKYDLINQGWTLYNFGGGGLLVQSNTLYFGDTTSSANIFNFGTVKADNGSPIQAYWKSKDFAGADPFLQNQLTNIDSFVKKDTGSTLTATYTTDTSTSTAYSISLSTSANVLENRKILPSGKMGYQFNMKYGDTSSSSQWEIFGFRIGFTQLPYRPTQ